MIKIEIKVDDKYIADRFDDRECTLSEVGIALHRLKQIEHILINKEFESDFEMREEE